MLYNPFILPVQRINTEFWAKLENLCKKQAFGS